MLETNLGEIRALAENSDPIIADPPNIKLLTGPLPNPGSDPNFFDLTPNDDAVQLANGILRNTPGGLRALTGNDFVRGSGGAELMNGNSGTDTLIGGCGSDTIRGGKILTFFMENVAANLSAEIKVMTTFMEARLMTLFAAVKAMML